MVVAAGMSTRMEGINKTFAELTGRPLIAVTLEAFDSSPLVDEIVVVLAQRDLGAARELLSSYGLGKVSTACVGGARRQDSVLNGLRALEPCDWVMVHDGARPGLSHELLERGLQAARETGAAVAGVPVKDTIKVAGEGNLVAGTPPRDTLWAAQTPQIFRYSLLMEAHERCRQEVTDDAAMVEMMGHPVQIFQGSYRNMKVTTPEDMDVMEALLKGSGRQGR